MAGLPWASIILNEPKQTETASNSLSNNDIMGLDSMGWLLAGQIEKTHNPEVTGSSPVPAIRKT